MNERVFNRLFPQGKEPEHPRDRAIRERQAHQFSSDIGGASANYVEPKFGTTPDKEEPS